MTPPIGPAGGPTKKVIVIDDCKNKDTDIDGDGIKDLTHGRLVSKCITAENKDVFVREKNAAKKGEENLSLGKIKRRLSGVVRSLNFGAKIDGVNMSCSRDVTYEGLSSRSGVENITPENINEHKDEIKAGLKEKSQVSYKEAKREYLANGDSYEFSRKGYREHKKDSKKFIKTLDKIEKITEKGVPVYVSAGNEGDNRYNMFTLADGTTSVGAKNIFGMTEYYSASNSDIDKYEKGSFQAVPICEEGSMSELKGYDLNNDKEIDIEASELSNQGVIPQVTSFSGTSFATPTALAKDLKEPE